MSYRFCGGNNGTEDAFINRGAGAQEFKDGGEFNTGVKVAKGKNLPCNRNNGTKNAFNNSGSGKQTFGKAKFNAGATYESLIFSNIMSGFLSNPFGFNGDNSGTEDAFNKKGTGKQEFKTEGEFNTGTGEHIARGESLPFNRNNGTKSEFNNSSSKGQKFRKTKFNTSAKVGCTKPYNY
ncbi:hypothetical protein E2542_SST16718 [Spatholobus suberectus]|nr:hypothetical protein E2542_SST16718 [Spatholobus suberectus]